MATGVHDFTETTIDGRSKSMKDYAGRVLLVVNVASDCEYTPQYAGLEALHESFGAKGLSVLGFPANDFGAQEPGSEADIKSFCATKFGVEFDRFAIQWNFTKFLVGKDGRVIGRFESKVEPTSAEIEAAITRAPGA